MIGSERGDVLFHVSRRGFRGGFDGISSRTVLMDLIFNCLLASCFELGDDPPCLVWGGHSKSPQPTVSGGIHVGLGIIEKDDLPWLAADRAYCVIEALSTGFHRPHLMGEEDVVKALEQAGDRLHGFDVRRVRVGEDLKPCNCRLYSAWKTGLLRR